MKNICLGLLLLFMTSNLTAQNDTKDATPNVFTKIIGHWEGKGTLMSNPATFEMQWNMTLNNKFIHLSFSNTFTDRQGASRSLASEAYYNFRTKTGVWIDSRGVILPLVLEFTSDTLTVLWGDSKTEQGKTIYKIHNDRIQVEDHVLKNEQYFLFGTASYARK